MARRGRLDRRGFLRTAGLAGALLLAPGAWRAPLPRTGFERSGDRAWTSAEDEAAFLQRLADASPRLAVTVIGRSRLGRPLHLVRVGTPGGPTVLFVCAQHGGEPASREAGLELVRTLALTADPVLVDQLDHQAVLVLVTANPDGCAAGTRGNGAADLNRDHLALTQPETRAMHAVLRDWAPDVVADLHEYRPPDPGRFHHDVLVLWPRNLNVDPGVRGLSRRLARGWVARGARAAGLTADEYARVTRAATAAGSLGPGGGDEGICRNAAGLRHCLGLLAETAATLDVRDGPYPTAPLRRRVLAQRQVMAATLRFMRRHGDLAAGVTHAAAQRRARAGAARSRPVFFAGADDDPPAPHQVADPPPCLYLLTAAQAQRLAPVFALYGVRVEVAGRQVAVPLAQPAAPVVPLLLDSRARRHLAAGRPVTDCG